MYVKHIVIVDLFKRINCCLYKIQVGSNFDILGKFAKDINSILTDLIEEPKNVSEEAILVSAISLLEAVVGYHFCPVVFCKTLVIVPRVMENGAEGMYYLYVE